MSTGNRPAGPLRDQLVRARGGTIAAGVSGSDPRGSAWLELTPCDRPAAAITLTEGEVLVTIEALAMVYAGLCGARPESLARGVNRTLRNRTRAAREARRDDQAAA